MPRVVCCWFLALGLGAASSPLLAADPSGPDPVREAVAAFLSAVKSHDVEAVLASADVPWFHMGQEIVRDATQLRKEFEVLFRRRNFADLQYQLLRTASYGAIRDKSLPPERQLLDEVLKPQDQVVLVSVDCDGRKGERIVLLVKLKGNKGKVVGLKE
jgi:hypothetical protein